MRRIIAGALCAILLICSGCETDLAPDTAVTAGLDSTGFEQLAQYFPHTEKATFRYSGTLDFGEILTLKNVERNNENIILEFEGNWFSGASDDEIEGLKERGIYRKYIISNDSVTECYRKTMYFYENSDYDEIDEYRESVVLKMPLEEGNKWSSKYTINEDKYDAETTIVKFDPELNTVQVETKVYGLDGYIDEVYIENNTFQIGRGLIRALYLTRLQEEYYIHIWIED